MYLNFSENSKRDTVSMRHFLTVNLETRYNIRDADKKGNINT